jgi:hypothetical protein
MIPHNTQNINGKFYGVFNSAQDIPWDRITANSLDEILTSQDGLILVVLYTGGYMGDTSSEDVRIMIGNDLPNWTVPLD